MHTSVSSAFALMVQGADQPAGTGEVQTDFFQLLGEGGAIAQTVLVILLLFSLISWAVIFYKFWQFARAERQTKTFLEVFRKSSKFSEVHAVCRTLTESPLTGLFQAGYTELNTQLRGTAPENKPAGAPARPTLKSLDAVDRALLRATTVEMNRLEARVPFLATTASITPFIGLFGTVWGIMDSFQRIGVAGSSSLAVVAPGIAHALIATAAGLFAAIPAVYFYNYYTNRVKHFSGEMDDFSLEFLNIAERNFT
ncbi:MAG TPA: MotA/TolQ/ExbB proton channel family protein [Vicinamibacterales bacterium]|nr:MotA/TolQ/ExbB proton channel family protein [Vicinamibacterales bacterium]